MKVLFAVLFFFLAATATAAEGDYFILKDGKGKVTITNRGP